MRQKRISLRGLFEKGINPISLRSKNQEYFSDLVNCGPSEEGFRSVDPEEFSYIYLTEDTLQVLSIGFKDYLLTPTRIFLINSDNSLTIKRSNITVGGRWSVADYQTWGFFSNGVVTIKVDEAGVLTTSTEIPQARVIFNYNGQLILGGLTTGFNSLVPNCVPSNAEGKGFIAWSGIGNIDCTPSEINVEAGFRSLNELGEIFGITSISNKLVVICSKGFTILPTFEHTFGRRDFIKQAPRDVDSWVAGEEEVFFIDKNGGLNQLGLEKLNSLGYREIFKSLSVRFFYQLSTKELFLSSSEKTYVLNPFGLFSIGGVFKTGLDRNKFVVSSLPLLKDSIFTTGVIDFEDPGMKIIEEVSLGMDTNGEEEDVKVCIYTRENLRGDWFQTPFFSLNELNLVKPHIAGVEFKIGVKDTNFSFVSINWISISYTKIDKRFNRGFNPKE